MAAQARASDAESDERLKFVYLSRMVSTLDRTCAEAEKMIKEHKKQMHDAIDRTVSELLKQCQALKFEEMEKISWLSSGKSFFSYRKAIQQLPCITFNANKETIDLLKQPNVFGKVTKSKQAFSRLAKIEHPQIKVKSNEDENTCRITGMVVLPGDRLLVTDYPLPYSRHGNAVVKVVDINDGVISSLKLSSAPWDAAVTQSRFPGMVALTLPRDKKIAMVSVTKSELTESELLEVDGHCRGVDCINKTLAVSFVNPDKIQLLKLNGDVIHTILGDQQGQKLLQLPYYLAFCPQGTSLYVSCWGSNSVEHVDVTGKLLNKYTDPEFEGPNAVNTSRGGDVFVCCESSNSIHLLSPQCERIQVLLTQADGLLQPESVCYGEVECRIYVGMFGSNVVRAFEWPI